MADSLEERVLAVHAARPGFTSRGFARSGSYDRIARCVPAGSRTLDLACGDGALLSRIPGAVGVDLSPDELALAAGPVIRARAQALPFRDHAFDLVTCHLAFMLFEDIEVVVRELDRVLAPGGRFVAMLGGGPVAEPAADDAFPVFLDLLPVHRQFTNGVRERRWAELFAGWDVPPWERCELVLDGNFDEVWPFLAASYELPDDAESLRDALATRLSGSIRCRAVTWLACATKPA